MEEKDAAIWGDISSSEDFSPSSTLILFDSPIPLLRIPIPAAPSDDPSLGPFVLAFRDAHAWKTAYDNTHSNILAQCLAGARVGCSISASKKCSTPWWKNFLGPATVDFAERELCERREMSSCLAAAEEQCNNFAKRKCLAPFRDARIASPDLKGRQSLSRPSSRDDKCSPRHNLEVTNFRGSDLMGDTNSPSLQ